MPLQELRFWSFFKKRKTSFRQEGNWLWGSTSPKQLNKKYFLTSKGRKIFFFSSPTQKFERTFRKRDERWPRILLLAAAPREREKGTKQSQSLVFPGEYLSNEAARWFLWERWYIPSKSERENILNKTSWPKDDVFPVHSGGSSLSVLFRWCVPAWNNNK